MGTAIMLNDYQGTREISLSAYLLKHRKVLLTGEINMNMANDFLEKMLYLQQENPDEEVNVYLNSSGGEVTAGMSIVNTIKNAGFPINIYVTGQAASMAAVILSCGSKRYMLPYSKSMIHEPLLEGAIRQKATNLQDMSISLMETKRIINQILAENTNKSIEEIDKLTQHDCWMDAKKTVEFGLADKVLEKTHMRGDIDEGGFL